MELDCEQFKKILGGKRSYSRWSEIETGTLSEYILETAVLENMLSTNVFELTFTLVGISMREGRNEMIVSLNLISWLILKSLRKNVVYFL